MKKFAKVMAFMLCAALLVCGGIFGTLAYLTSQTSTITNTFTVGNVKITLTEGRINANGKIPNADDRIDSGNQNFKLMPGGSYEKDPTIKVDANSESCYIYVQVVNEIAGIEAADTVATQMAANGWVALDGVTNVYCKEAAVAAGSTHILFSTVKIRGDVDNATLAPYMNKTIKITGYAVQSFGFDTAKDAWTAANFTL
jgi:predicted ribosomally synthesized peptide with SipW-like signal peptide